MSTLHSPIAVRYWYVCLDTKKPDGKTVISEPLSLPFDAPRKAEEALERIKERTPEAYICEAARYFNEARQGDREKIAEFKSTLH